MSRSIIGKYCCQPLTVSCCFRNLEMFKESEHILKEALGTCTKLYGEESAEVAEVLNGLGATYYAWSQLQKSRYANNHNKIKVHSCKIVFCSQTTYYRGL